MTPQIQLFDTIRLDDAAQVRFTEHGYLAATPRVARSGIQLYSGDDVGMPGVRVVRVWRPPDEVFSNDSLRTYAGKPVTIDHPKVPVTADNWKELARGGLGEDVLRDGQFIRVPMILMDKGAIKEYEAGKKQLSLGYVCDIEFKSGVTESGETYDAVQHNIRANHLAVVTAARGGEKLRIGDDNLSGSGDWNMNDVTRIALVVDGVSLTMDATSAGVINAAIKRMDDAARAQKELLDAANIKISAMQTDAATKATEHKTALDAASAKVTTLEKQVADSVLTPAKLQDAARAYADVIGKARAILGDKLVTEGKDTGDIMRQVVDSHLGEAAKGWTSDMVSVSFTSITKNVKAGDATNKTVGDNSLDAVALLFATPAADGTPFAALDKAYTERDARLAQAWKQ